MHMDEVTWIKNTKFMRRQIATGQPNAIKLTVGPPIQHPPMLPYVIPCLSPLVKSNISKIRQIVKGPMRHNERYMSIFFLDGFLPRVVWFRRLKVCTKVKPRTVLDEKAVNQKKWPSPETMEQRTGDVAAGPANSKNNWAKRRNPQSVIMTIFAILVLKVGKRQYDKKLKPRASMESEIPIVLRIVCRLE